MSKKVLPSIKALTFKEDREQMLCLKIKQNGLKKIK